MTDSTLRYIPIEHLDDLQEPGTCTVRRCRRWDGSSYQRLWFVVRLDGRADAPIVLLSVGLNPRGSMTTDAHGERLWGFNQTGPRTWAVSPSIHLPNQWHHTPQIIDVPETPAW